MDVLCHSQDAVDTGSAHSDHHKSLGSGGTGKTDMEPSTPTDHRRSRRVCDAFSMAAAGPEKKVQRDRRKPNRSPDASHQEPQTGVNTKQGTSSGVEEKDSPPAGNFATDPPTPSSSDQSQVLPRDVRDSHCLHRVHRKAGERWLFKSRATVLSGIVASNRGLEKDLKAKNEELEDVKRKLQREQENAQKAQKEAKSLESSLQDARSRLQRSQDSGDKLRQENKRKADQVEKMERNISHMEDRIRNLEIRASEVEKAELTLESTRRNLENSQHECRAKEGEISRLQTKYDKTCLELDQAHTTIKELEKKMDDLKHQVRYELMKNENIERGLETIPHLKDDLAERDKKIGQLERDLDEKGALLVAARKAVREYKDRIRDLEKEGSTGESVRRELELAQHEVGTLKHLLLGKDSLLHRKTQALDQAKLIIESLHRTRDEKEKLKKIQQILTKLASIHADTVHVNGVQQNGIPYQKRPLTPRSRTMQDGSRELSVDTAPFRDSSDCPLLERCLQENQPPSNHTHNHTHSHTPTHTQTAVVHPVRRSSSFNDANHHHHHRHPRGRTSPRPHSRATPAPTGPRQGSGNVYRPETRPPSRFPPSLDYALGGVGAGDDEGWATLTGSPRPPTSSNGPSGPKARRPFSAAYVAGDGITGSDLTSSRSSLDTEEDGEDGCRDDQVLARLALSGRQKDDVLAAAIAVGDRVSFTVQQKPPRYGRKKVKPIVYTGIVKYVGKLDKEQYDARVYCGVRLDEPLGEQDGVYKGKRYMFTPQNHAKFFKIRDVNSILDVKSGQYIPTSRLLVKHLKKSQSFHRDGLVATM